MTHYIIGVDEAGRGALAGPVCVGAILYPSDFDWREVFALVTTRGEARLRDSKKLTTQQRAILFEHIASHGRLKHASGLVGAGIIDEIGIVNACYEAATIAIAGLGVDPSRVEVLLDAGLRVPSRWRQESFVRGDENIPAIALASIVAKVTRDRWMENLRGDYERYDFSQHKGYGTVEHRRRIAEYGLSDIHRASFTQSRTPHQKAGYGEFDIRRSNSEDVASPKSGRRYRIFHYHRALGSAGEAGVRRGDSI